MFQYPKTYYSSSKVFHKRFVLRWWTGPLCGAVLDTFWLIFWQGVRALQVADKSENDQADLLLTTIHQTFLPKLRCSPYKLGVRIYSFIYYLNNNPFCTQLTAFRYPSGLVIIRFHMLTVFFFGTLFNRFSRFQSFWGNYTMIVPWGKIARTNVMKKFYHSRCS